MTVRAGSPHAGASSDSSDTILTLPEIDAIPPAYKSLEDNAHILDASPTLPAQAPNLPSSIIISAPTSSFQYLQRPEMGWWRSQYPQSYSFPVINYSQPVPLGTLIPLFTLAESFKQVITPDHQYIFNMSNWNYSLAWSSSYDLNVLFRDCLFSGAIQEATLKLFNSLACVYLNAYAGPEIRKLLPPVFKTTLQPEIDASYKMVIYPRADVPYINHTSGCHLMIRLALAIGGYANKLPCGTFASYNVALWALTKPEFSKHQNISCYKWPMVDSSSVGGNPASSSFSYHHLF